MHLSLTGLLISMLKLNDITLVAVASTKIKQTIDALNYSTQSINFAEVCLITHENINTSTKINVKKIEELKSIKDWSKFIIFDLRNFISTKYILLVHWDGFVVNPRLWRNEFLQYDFIGSPWPKFKKIFPQLAERFPEDKYRVGNSVSIRSKKFLEIPTKINLNWNIDGKISNFHEDGYVCIQKRSELEKNGIVFAPFDLACNFGREYTFAENKEIQPFIFHKWYAKNKNYPTLSHQFGFKEKFKRLINFGYF